MVLVTVALSGEAALWKLALVAVAFGLPGALSAVLQPHNPVGWLLLVDALAFASLGLATQWVAAGHDSAWALWWTDRAGAVVVPLTLGVLLLLPDGRLPSPRWRPVAAAALTLQVGVVAVWSLVASAPGTPGAPNPIGVLPASWAGPVDTIGDWLLPLPLLLVLAAVAVRIRPPRRPGSPRQHPVGGRGLRHAGGGRARSVALRRAPHRRARRGPARSRTAPDAAASDPAHGKRPSGSSRSRRCAGARPRRCRLGSGRCSSWSPRA